MLLLIFSYNFLNDTYNKQIDSSNNTIASIDDLTAAFGPRLPDDGFIGYINVAEPITGCSPIKPPPNVSYVNQSKWIALIQRTPGSTSNCSFDLKVHNAQLAGYKAVIIFNLNSDDLIKMSSSGMFSIKIPSVFVGHSSGLDIISQYTYKNLTFVQINSDDNNLDYLLIPFASVVGICFTIALIVFVCFVYLLILFHFYTFFFLI
jgi:E3 ubiquitin-protein ligase RNF13